MTGVHDPHDPEAIAAEAAGLAALISRAAKAPAPQQKPTNLEAIEARPGTPVPVRSDARASAIGDTTQALAFLRSWPAAFPHLVAISNSGLIEARAFTREDLCDNGPVAKWIDERQGRANLYFSVNSLRSPIDKKAAKTDVEEVVALHSDIDAPSKVDQEAFAQHATSALLKFEPKPSVIVKSGGGVQAFWILEADDRIPILGDESNAEAAERYTRGIKDLLASQGLTADSSCHNVDRILRLPGTINLPNKTKIDKGRKTALATLAHFSEAVYPLSTFTPAAPKRSVSPHKSKRMSARSHYPYVDPNDPELVGLDDKWKDPELADEYDGDRSRALMAFAIACKVAGISDETLENMLMTWEIGQHIRDQADAPRALARTLQRAKERVAGSEDELPPVDIGDPTDLWAEERDPPDLPEGILPEALERWARDEAKRIGTSLGASGLAGIVVCSAALSSRFRVQVKQKNTDHTERPILWGTFVGAVSARKSPIFKSMMKALESIEQENDQANQEALQQFEKEHNRWKKAKEPTPEPKRPRLRRLVVQDATTEKLAEILVDNPDGLICAMDELSQWAANMDAYKQGKAVSRDQTFWLDAKGGVPFRVDRIARGSINVPNTAICVIGGIQPNVIKRLAKSWGDNGLMQRFMIVNLPASDIGLDAEPDEIAQRTMYEAVRRIHSQQPTEYFDTFKFPPEADLVRQRMVNFSRSKRALDIPEPLIGWVDKIEGEWARLACVLHCIEWAAADEETRSQMQLGVISLQAAERAERFLIEFQWPHQLYFYRKVADLSAAADSEAQRVAGFLLAHPRDRITEQNIQKNFRNMKRAEDRPLRIDVTQTLEMHGWLIPDGHRHKEGHNNRWKVNQKIYDGRFERRAAIERASRAAQQTSIVAEGITRKREKREASGAPTWLN
jgi:hypothetical protein